MKKDIDIPVTEHLYLAAVQEYHEEFEKELWTIYLVNARPQTIEMVLLVSRGSSGDQKTSVIRRSIAEMTSNSYARIEFLTDDLLSFENEFMVTFFEGGQMFEKTFVFQEGSITEDLLEPVPVMQRQGVLGK